MAIFQNALHHFLQDNITKANYITPNVIARDTQITDRKGDDKYLVHQKIGGTSPLGLNGPLYVYETLFQLDSYSYRKIDSQAIMQQAKNKLNGFQGEMGEFKVFGIEINSHEDDYETDTELYREQLDINILYAYKGVKINE